MSLALIFVDHRFDSLVQVRSWLSVLVTPIQLLADTPARLVGNASLMVSSRSELVEENARLKARSLILEQKIQKLASLNAENVRLRELLNSSRLVNEKVVVAELIGIDPDPTIKQVLVNKGELDGVYVGQPLLDATGVMGQVIQTSPFTSRVILITDTSSRIPVQVNRNGYRAIAAGAAQGTELELQHVPATAEITEGDLLVSSGMGQRYPVGFPVAKVTEVTRNPGQPFLSIRAQPLARLNRSRLVMLVFTSERNGVVASVSGSADGESANREEVKE